jgi:D-xylose transport system permease protein
MQPEQRQHKKEEKNDMEKIRFRQNDFLEYVRRYTMLIALISIWVIFWVLTQGIFVSPRNLSNLFLQTSSVAIIAIGMTLVIITRNIDLSVGSVAALAGAIAAYMQVELHLSTPVALSAALIVGLAIGAWHGFWIAYRMVPAFIVTLASMMIFRGLVLGVTQGTTIAPLSDSFKVIGQGYANPKISLIIGAVVVILFVVSSFSRREKRKKYGFSVPKIWLDLIKVVFIAAAISGFFAIMFMNRGVPYAVLLMLVLAIFFVFLSRNTVFGRQLYAIGGNPDAAALSGVNIKQRVMMLYVIFGALTAVSGIVMTSRLNAATTSAGQGMELDVIAASIIGGTSLMGGQGTIFGAVIGALIMASLDNGMSLLDTNITYQYIIKGMILLLAVWVDIATRKK